MTIKISAFPAAATPMGAGDTVTGLQGGANVNFSKAQLLNAPDAVATNANGTSLYIRGGKGNGTGYGGGLLLYSGYGGASGAGGTVQILAGEGYGSAAGGQAGIYGGPAAGTGNGGDVKITSGRAIGSGRSGNIQLIINPSGSSTYGNVLIPTLPLADPHVVGALWFNSLTGALFRSLG